MNKLIKKIKNNLKRTIGESNVKKVQLHTNRLLRSLSLDFNNMGSIEKEINLQLDTKKFQVNDYHTFFGYYDKTPFSLDNSKLLAMFGPRNNRPPMKDDELNIGYFDLNTNRFHQVGKTSTWCWQQGCRLQWFPENENQLIIYNKIVNDSYGSVIQDIESGDILKYFLYPIYDINKDGSLALSLNFSRLHRLRPGYGYINIPDYTEKELCPESDGIWILDLKSGNKELIVSLKDLSNLKPLKSMEGAIHYINHLSFNPSGERFMFIHLWLKDNLRYGRLVTLDTKGSNIYILANEGHVSHYAWKSKDELLLYSTHKETGQHYHMYNDCSSNRNIVGKRLLDRDGHPSYSPDRKLLLTDTKPNRYGEQHLVLYNPSQDSLIRLGSFFNPLNYTGEVRCDLHPRWDRVGRYICFDSAHQGSRAIYLIDLQKCNY